MESCKMNGLRPVKYIADVLRELVSGETDYMALLPMNIAK
ncbi:transposase domain-containing protein [Bacteroides fragilis]